MMGIIEDKHRIGQYTVTVRKILKIDKFVVRSVMNAITTLTITTILTPVLFSFSHQRKNLNLFFWGWRLRPAPG